MKKRTLTWLHLSDFHFKKDENWQQQVVLESLLRDVVKKLPEKNLQPDMVLVTGDIAQSGKKEEYDQAEAFFNEVSQILDLKPEDHWFIAPGNHDVDRNKVKPFQSFRKGITREESGNMYAEPDFWETMARRQEAYLAFTDRFLGVERAWKAQRPWQVGFHEKNGFRTALCCLNTALASQDDSDHRNLFIGEYQAREAMKETAGADLKIALFHHPFDDLKPFDKTAVRGVLTGSEGCHFLLRGHLHETDLALGFTPNGGHLELAAGACWQDADHPHAVMAVQLDLDASTVTTHVWSCTSNKGGFWKAANELYQGMPNGQWTDKLPWTLNTSEEKAPLPQARIPALYKNYLGECSGTIESLVVNSGVPLRFKLKRIYVPLTTDWREPGQEKIDGEKQETPPSRPLSELLDLEEQRRFLIVGEPGGGKSTFLAFSALKELERENGRLPLCLELKQFGTWLEGHTGEDPELWLEWAGKTLKDYGLDAANLQQRIGEGRALWLLDGLDEIFNPAIRLRAVKILAAWIRTRGEGDWWVVTSRPHALQQKGLTGTLCFPNTAYIKELGEEHQQIFLQRWYEILYEEGQEDVAQTQYKKLWRALSKHRALVKMRGNPLMLSTIAAIFHHGKNLPERRADLYGRVVDLLLENRFGPLSGGSERKMRKIKEGLSTTALAMMKEGKIREMGHRDLVGHLKDALYEGAPKGPEKEALEELAAELGGHSGLLTTHGEPPRYEFRHLAFQEYLAACALGDEETPIEGLKTYMDDSAWEEVILLTAGYLFEAGVGRMGQGFVAGLRDLAKNQAKRIRRLSLAVRAAAEAPDGALPESRIQDLQMAALMALSDESLVAGEKDRIALGHALGQIGDPRLDPGQRANWVAISGGRFSMGSEDLDKTLADFRRKASRPVHEVAVSSFHLGRYPVTNEEYGLFWEDGGYHTRKWWSEEGWRWREKEGVEEPAYWESWRFNGRNQPVVGVGWHEARAYCAWLEARLKKDGLSWLPDGNFKVDLPSEAQWEFAARGTENRPYPWGDQEPDSNRANFSRNGSPDGTTPVGIYLEGATPEGCLDMAGNVWEWCLDVWREDVYAERQGSVLDPLNQEGDSDLRSLRGGSWLLGSGVLPAAIRYWTRAGDRNRSIGFRVCLSPVPAEHVSVFDF